MQPKLLLLAALVSGMADAASVDLLRGVVSDGVFRQARSIPADRLLRGEHGYELLPAQFGGDWSVVLGGTTEATSTVHFTFAGGKKALETGGATVGKLLGRMTGRAAVSCFNMGTERLPDLKSWLEMAVKAAQDTTLERSFGPLKVQLLVNRTDGDAGSPEGLAEVDVLLSRRGTPGVSPWNSVCKR
ncbi:hypothetical protein Q0M94_16810 [Deinococcus radiomollis]|uniref:hypothetical protein n=1 Tax=Deinococcus radiomollis TaxID=468916 RepID=UPI0038925C14